MNLLLRKVFSDLGSFATLAVACVFFGICICGCQPAASGPMVAQARSPIPDVQLPLGFEMEDMRSRSWASGNLRFVDHLYSGSGERVSVVDFFEKQMPISGWTSIGKQFTQGRMTLDYVKSDEKCRITVYKGGMYKATYIQIAIWKDTRKMKK